MKEFMCPDGTMSVNQICRMFMSKADRDRLAGIVPKPDESLITGTKKVVESIERGSGTDIKNIPTIKKSFDEKYESIEDIPVKKQAQGFNFDFDQVTDFKESADNMISSNINYYNNFVEDKLGIPSNVQTALRIGSSAYSALTGGSLMSVAAPFAIPFMIGGALRGKEENRVRDITMRDTQGDIQTTPARIMNIQPTPQDIYRGGGSGREDSAISGINNTTGGPVSNRTGRGRTDY